MLPPARFSTGFLGPVEALSPDWNTRINLSNKTHHESWPWSWFWDTPFALPPGLRDLELSLYCNV